MLPGKFVQAALQWLAELKVRAVERQDILVLDRPDEPIAHLQFHAEQPAGRVLLHDAGVRDEGDRAPLADPVIVDVGLDLGELQAVRARRRVAYACPVVCRFVAFSRSCAEIWTRRPIG